MSCPTFFLHLKLLHILYYIVLNLLAGAVNTNRGPVELDPSIIHQSTTGILSSRFSEQTLERNLKVIPQDRLPRSAYARGGSPGWGRGRGVNAGYEFDARAGYGRGTPVGSYGRGAPYGEYMFGQADAYGAAAYGFQNDYNRDNQWNSHNFYSQNCNANRFSAPQNFPGGYPRNSGFDVPQGHYRGRGAANYGRGRGTFDPRYQEAEFQDRQKSYPNYQPPYAYSERSRSSQGEHQLEESPPKKGKLRSDRPFNYHILTVT